MKIGVTLMLTFLMSCASQAATVIVSYSGGTDPVTQGWTRAVANTNVVAGSYDDDGRAVWRIYDPGLGRPETTDPANNLYYQKSLTSTLLNDVLTNGWEFSATLKVPLNDPTPGGVALTPNGHSWVGLVYTNPEDTSTRLVFGFNAGRDAQGRVIISVNSISGSSRTLDAGYQNVRMVYDPITKLASAYINDVLIGTTSGSSTTAGASVMYWGDNSSQTTAVTPRATYYESVNFIMVPEPSTVSLCGLGVMLWMFLYRRRARPCES